MFLKKLKEENKRLEKRNRELKAELSEAQMKEIEMRKLLADKHTEHTHADVLEALRRAIIRKCEGISAGADPLQFLICKNSPEPAAAEIALLVSTYRDFMAISQNDGAADLLKVLAKSADSITISKVDGDRAEEW